ncbi:hypothetical protein LCGC14_0459470 [marine sediment metagenome]|uniref:Uncharacterized protein n=1 Tax=marine sediment metagenome TaxID=412755 RepID=A0A0F9VPG3_9ZZZZ
MDVYTGGGGSIAISPARRLFSLEDYILYAEDASIEYWNKDIQLLMQEKEKEINT